jgi:hypothetical protein
MRFPSPSRSVFALLLATAVVACDDGRATRLPAAPEVAPNELSAYLAVSQSDPTVGSQFSVTVRTKRGSAVAPVGSFTIRLTFDTTRVRYHDVGRSELGMVMANGAKPGLVLAAGASGNGFTSDELLVATFTALAPDAAKALHLTVEELNSVGFEDQRGKVRISRELYRDTKKHK